MKKIITVVILAAMSIGFAGQSVYAASASIYLSLSSPNMAQGQTLTVNLRENSDNILVNAAYAHLMYPSDKLKLLSVENSLDFNIQIPNGDKYNEGSIKLIRGAQPAIFGDQLIAIIKFEALANENSNIVSLNNSESVLASCGKNILTSPPNPECIYTPPLEPTPPSTTTIPPRTTTPPSASPPLSLQAPPPPTVASENKVSVAITTPNTRRQTEPTYISFWIPIVILAASLMVSALRAKGYRIRGINRHFRFLLPSSTRKYNHR